MPDLSTIALFILACLALNATPGPDMLLVATRSAAQGRTAGLATYLGIATGAYVHATALAFGLSKLFIAVPIAYDVVRILGAVYLLYLAWQAFTSSTRLSDKNENSASFGAWTMYRQGLITNVLNPKVALFFLALFPQFLQPANGNVAVQIMVLATILNLSGLFVNGLVILAANKARTLFAQNSRTRRTANYLTGFVFTGLAARLAFDTSK